MAVLETATYTCAPSSLTHSDPCLSCLSEKQLLAVLVSLLATHQSHTAAVAMSASACFTCMSRHEMLQSLVTIVAHKLDVQPDAAVASNKCLMCATEQQLLAAALLQVCNLTTIT